MKTYRHHRQQNESSRCGFLGPIGRVDQAVDRRRGENQATCEVSDHGDMIGLRSIRGDNHKDACDYEKVVDHSPPCIGRKARAGLDLSNNRRNERYHPCQLVRCQLMYPIINDLSGARTRGIDGE